MMVQCCPSRLELKDEVGTKVSPDDRGRVLKIVMHLKFPELFRLASIMIVVTILFYSPGYPRPDSLLFYSSFFFLVGLSALLSVAGIRDFAARGAQAFWLADREKGKRQCGGRCRAHIPFGPSSLLPTPRRIPPPLFSNNDFPLRSVLRIRKPRCVPDRLCLLGFSCISSGMVRQFDDVEEIEECWPAGSRWGLCFPHLRLDSIRRRPSSFRRT